jgi:hypothetical protein
MNATLLDRSELPNGFAGVDELEAFMARPSRELVDDLAIVSGDILVLGAGGKMGPTLAKLARNAGAAMAVQPDPISKWCERGSFASETRHFSGKRSPPSRTRGCSTSCANRFSNSPIIMSQASIDVLTSSGRNRERALIQRR